MCYIYENNHSYFVLQQYNEYVGKLLYFLMTHIFPTDGRICALCVKFRYNVRTEIADNMGGLWAGVFQLNSDIAQPIVFILGASIRSYDWNVCMDLLCHVIKYGRLAAILFFHIVLAITQTLLD